MTRSRTAAGSRPRGHAIQNALIAAAILAEFVVIVGHPLFGWGAKTQAATPRALVYDAPQPPSGQAVLVALAATAARFPAEGPTSRTPYAYVYRKHWQLARTKSPPSTVSPTQTESWLRSDGSGRMLSTTSGRKGSATDDVSVASGHPLPVLSARPATLAHLLGLGYPAPVASARPFLAFTDLADSEPISPPVEASILRVLALDRGVINSGTVIDRDGRHGVAVSVESGSSGVEILYTLIFDPSTGSLLEADQTLAESAGNLDVPQGSVLAYTTFLAAGYVDSVTTRAPA